MACVCVMLAKGRTNIELREQFILADGVSQSMSAFKPKTSTGSRSTSITSGSAGPITKVSPFILFFSLFFVLLFPGFPL